MGVCVCICVLFFSLRRVDGNQEFITFVTTLFSLATTATKNVFFWLDCRECFARAHKEIWNFCYDWCSVLHGSSNLQTISICVEWGWAFLVSTPSRRKKQIASRNLQQFYCFVCLRVDYIPIMSVMRRDVNKATYPTQNWFLSFLNVLVIDAEIVKINLTWSH